jgi:hypothetical protein
MCPLKIVTHRSSILIEAYSQYKKDRFPNSGTWIEQAGVFIDAMNMIESEFARLGKDHK